MLRAALSVTLLALARGILLGRRSTGEDPAGAEDADMAASRMPPRAVLPLPKALRSGLVFNHMPKAGGSTFGGIMRRIAYRRGLAHARDNGWLGNEAPSAPRLPAVYADHGRIADVGVRLRSRLPGAFWVTLLRDPISRCLSSFYHLMVTREGVPPSEENKRRYIQSNCSGDMAARTVGPGPSSASSEEILASYGFVAVTERFDESLLLLAKKLGVGLADVLYLWGKKSGSSVVYATGRELAYHPPLGEEPESVQRVARAIFGAGLDALLLEAANLALDRARGDYGPSFREDLANLRRLLAAVQAKCQSHY